MAVKIGNLESVLRQEQLVADAQQVSAKASLLALIGKAKQINLAGTLTDIRDTYHYIRETYPNDTSFSKGLWNYLCSHPHLDMNSFWSVSGCTHNPKHCSKTVVSRYGISIMSDENGKYLDSKDVIRDINGHDENVWRGKVLLEDYINEHDVCAQGLKQWEDSLVVLIRDFPRYAEEFFRLVDTHTIWKKP